MKNKKNLKYIIIAVALIAIAITIVTISIISKRNGQEQNSQEQQKNIDISIEYKAEEEDTNWRQSSYEDIELNSSINITKSGTYHLTGNIENGNITVNAGDEDLIRLVLDNVNITCNYSSAINVENAKKVIIIVQEGTINTLIDGSAYLTQDEPDACLFSKDDLVINGTGILNVNANYLDGITSKDDLKIIGTTINVNANDDGIKGKDYVGMKNANITVNAKSDGIKSTNDTEIDKGYIVIENSNINIESEQDGIQAETSVKIIDGEFNIKTGGGSANSSISEEWGNWGMRDKGMNPMNITKNTTIEDEVSAKGIKGNTGILIESGSFNIDSSDDSIHSNGTIVINNGTFEISSGDDGMHSDESLVINNGEINISKSYEGIESSKIEINGGTIDLIASDDGINIAGGNDSSSINGRPGQNEFSSNSEQILTINDGSVSINADGDGIDINGSGYINGGTVIVNGPTNDGNGALDYSGKLEVIGGELIAVGSSGMMQTPSNSSTIYSISYVYSEQQQANTKISVKNSNNEEIISYTPSKIYSSTVISSNKLEKGKTYTIYSNDEKVEEITINNIVTSAGESSGMQMQGGGMNKNPIQMEKPEEGMNKQQMQGGQKPTGAMMH